MRIILSLILSFVFSASQAQSLERKIIVQNGKFYYMSVDENIQLATLYAGSISQPLKLAKAFALPAGRGISAETNPLAWDLFDEHIFAINFLDHSLNDRNEAIKKIPVSSLKEWGPIVRMEELMMESIDQHMFQLNEPYLFVKNRSNYLNHFYFDGLIHQSAYWMAMANNDELTIWRNTNEGWKNSEVIDFSITNYFSLVSNGDQLFLITYEGDIYSIGLNGLLEIKKGNGSFDLARSILIDDRDNQMIYTFPSTGLNLEKSLEALILSSGKPLTL